jgi:hypothetical protein
MWLMHPVPATAAVRLPAMRRTAAALVMVGVLLAGCSDGEAADYDDEFRTDFVTRCIDTYAQPGAEQVCDCWYGAVSEAIDYEDLPSLDELMGDDFDSAPTRLPGSELDVPMSTLAACVRRIGAQPTVGTAPPPPTLPRPPTTPAPTTTVPA